MGVVETEEPDKFEGNEQELEFGGDESDDAKTGVLHIIAMTNHPYSSVKAK